MQYIANMHGDETINREMMLRFIYELCSSSDARIQALRDNTILHLTPSLNPDGFNDHRNCTRLNANNVDLNRNFFTADFPFRE